MQLKSIELTNFASYKHLQFSFDSKGLTLIYGDNGSGKSTFMDGPCWILTGQTSKGGTSDEVLAWNSTEPTTGILQVLHNNTLFTVYRARGHKSNDLYYTKDNSEPIRGKDLKDTQKLINKELNTDFEYYSTSTYFHEFSKAASFFTLKAKDRRLLCEDLADLSLAVTIKDKAKLKEKEVKNLLSTTTHALEINLYKQHNLVKNNEELEKQSKEIALEDDKHLKELKDRLARYSEDIDIKTNILNELIRKSKLNTCSQCGTPKDKTLNSEIRSYELQIKALETKIDSVVQEIETPKKPINFDSIIALNKKQIDKLDKETKQLAIDGLTFEQDILKLEMLNEVIDTYRASTITSVISFIQDTTNNLLATYFDSMFKITMEASDSDNIDLTIFKDSNECSFTQISKGQRCVLKLCFSIALMKLLKETKTSCTTLFFDESLDGLSSENKLKSYRLFESLALEYENVFVVEHDNSLKSMFENSIQVILTPEGSVTQ